MIKQFLGRIFRRNYAISEVKNFKSPTPVYKNWTIRKAVSEGYGSNVWIYRAVNLIVKNLANIPWAVKRDLEFLPEHHLSKLFQLPNNKISKNDIWELWYSWLELAGNAYAIKLKIEGKTEELWPVSPDRMDPMQGPNITDWIDSYILDANNKKTKEIYETEEILHLKFFNPSNPFIGIGPLQAAAKIADVDNDQIDWGKSTMQNRGVIDGIFAFERPFESIEDTEELAKNINQKYAGKKNARKIGVLGGNARYFRTALTPQESDFSKSRKDNRDEIFIAFGVPPQLGGSQEASTYNNFEVSILIFWFSTLIPILDDIKSELNFSFKDELRPGEVIGYDLSNVQAIRKALLDRSETAEKLFKMGVPFEDLNRIFQFGVKEFDKWEKSYVQTTNNKLQDEDRSNSDEDKKSANENSPKFNFAQQRASDDLQDEIEKAAEKNKKIFEELLTYQQKIIFEAVDKGEGNDAANIISTTEDKWKEKMTKVYVDTGVKFGMDIIKEAQRQAEDVLTQVVTEYLDDEMVVLVELSGISMTTSTSIVQHVAEGLKEGQTAHETQQAIIDAGIFSPVRALRLSRTITGNGANLGQWEGARLTGATHKSWMTAGFGVRPTHEELEGVTIQINEVFNVGGEAARYPLDNRLSPKERVNCRCTLSYSIE